MEPLGCSGCRARTRRKAIADTREVPFSRILLVDDDVLELERVMLPHFEKVVSPMKSTSP